MTDMSASNHLPLVSVIMPAYNASGFIEAAIRSVLSQTYENWELLVIDDCSTDNTCQIVEALALQDDRIRLFPNKENQGVAKARNRGFDLCRGDYVALLDSDDFWFPTKLEKQVCAALQTQSDIIYCSYSMIDREGRSICEDFIVPESTDYDSFLVQSVISCSTALLSRSVYTRHRFPTDYYHEDFILWVRLLRDGYTAHGISEVLAGYRLMEGTRSSDKVRSAINRWKIYRDYLKLPYAKSLVLIAKYATLGLRKYKRHRLPTNDRSSDIC